MGLRNDLLNRWLAPYADPMFLWFPAGALLVSAVSVLLFVVLFSTILERCRIAPSAPRKSESLRRTGEAIRLFFLNYLVLSVLASLLWPVLRIAGIHTGQFPSLFSTAMQLLFFLLIDDFLFYFVHRLLHRKPFYRTVHSIHHRIRQSEPIGAIYFHPVEYVLMTFSSMAGPLLIGTHVGLLYLWIVIRQWIAVEADSGYLLKRNPLNLIPFHDCAFFHAAHHLRITGNYGLFFTYMDRIFRSFSDGYRSGNSIGVSRR